MVEIPGPCLVKQGADEWMKIKLSARVTVYTRNRIGGVMVSVLASSTVDCGLEP